MYTITVIYYTLTSLSDRGSSSDGSLEVFALNSLTEETLSNTRLYLLLNIATNVL